MSYVTSKIIAHRGASSLAPENTLVAALLAWNNGIKKVEVDVQLTKDFELVAIHDFTTLRTANKNVSIADSSLEEIKKLDFGSWKDSKWKNIPIPTLEELLNAKPKEATLVIEIKTGTEIIPHLVKKIENLLPHEIEIISFDYEVLKKLKSKIPKFIMLWLLDLDYPSNQTILPLEKYIELTKNAGLDGLNIWAGKIADKKYIQEIKENNLLVYTWTINDFKQAQEFIANGVDGLTTDHPIKFLKALNL